MLENFKVYDLFGIPGNNKFLNFDENLTIIVGKNGSGKTTILNMLNAIQTRTFDQLLNYDFKLIELKSDEGNIKVINYPEKIVIKRTDIDRAVGDFIQNNKLKISNSAVKQLKDKLESDETTIITNFKDEQIEDQFQAFISSIYIALPKNEDVAASMRPSFKRFNYNAKGLYFPTYRRLENDIIIKNLIEPALTRFFGTRKVLPDIISNEVDTNSTIVGLSNKDIGAVVAKKWAEIAEIEKQRLNSLVKEFVYALLEAPITNDLISSEFLDIDTDSIKSDLEEVVIKTGLNDRSGRYNTMIQKYIDNINWSKEIITNFSVNFSKTTEENQQKLINDFNFATKISFAYEKVSRIINMYRDTSNELAKVKSSFYNLTAKLQEFIDKKIEIKDGELRFIQSDDILHFENLSAGEKQLVSLFVYTRLSLGPGATVIIDEPELSLHVNWQRKFLRALISEEHNKQYIVSTHSPFIIAGFRDKI